MIYNESQSVSVSYVYASIDGLPLPLWDIPEVEAAGCLTSEAQ